jgi:hydroxymethylpyrimidine/phosphomethylpyrimidine kinase
MQIQGKTVTLEITSSILDEICRQTDSQPRTHKQVGCLLSSAIACALAKASGKPVTIQNETRNQETKTTQIEYQILEV